MLYREAGQFKTTYAADEDFKEKIHGWNLKCQTRIARISRINADQK